MAVKNDTKTTKGTSKPSTPKSGGSGKPKASPRSR